MKPQFDLLKLALCGPSDVAKEIQIAHEVVDEWNLQHGEVRGFWVKHQHWTTDSHPEMGDRPQGIVNRQVIDDSDVLVAIFWSRFGTPTGAAASGTEEEIRRTTRMGRKVMVYFSDLEPLPADTEQVQLERLWQFRRELGVEGLCGRFASRVQFRRDFTRHLNQVLNELRPLSTGNTAQSGQVISGSKNIQVGRDLHVYAQPPIVKPVVERREGSVTSAESLQVQKWIAELADGTVGMLRKSAFAMWWSRFKNHFQVEKYEELSSERMDEAEAWFREQRAIQKQGLKSKAPDEWKRSRIAAIKAAMSQMGATNESYYPGIARRLKMKQPFVSLKDLTKTDLERVYTLVLRDARGG